MTRFVERCFFAPLAVVMGLAFGPVGHADTHDEFAIKKRMQRERVDSYYQRLDYLDRTDEARHKGELEAKLERKARIEIAEHHRREFVRTRPTPRQDVELKLEQEKAERQARLEAARRDFVKKREEMKRALSDVETINENEEFGLNPNYEAEEASRGDEAPDVDSE